MRPTLVAVSSLLLFAVVVTSQPPPFHGYMGQRYGEPHFAPVMHNPSHSYYHQPRPLSPHHQHFHHPHYSHGPSGPAGFLPQFSQFAGQESPSKLLQYHSYPPVTVSNTYFQPFGQMPHVQSFHPFFNNFQSYLYDPYMNHPAPPRIGKGSSPPFGFIEKQARNPNADPADIVRIAPPKAIMTTSVEVLGLAQGPTEAESPYHQENENYDDTYPRRSVSQDMKKQSWISRDPSERKSTTPFSNKQDNNSNNRKSKISSKLNSFSSSSGVEVAADNEPNHISEPILSHDALSLFSSLKSRESNQEQGQEQHSQSPDDDFDRDHSSSVAASSENGQIEKPEPIALFETEAGSPVQNTFIDEMEEAVLSSLSNSVNSEEDEGKRRIYHCPNARDLNELAGADVFPDPVRCDQFYYCKWGKAFVFQCPLNHFFNPYLKACDDDSDFACSMSLKK